jgi:transcriptional regulator with XRE-family HTH domain
MAELAVQAMREAKSRAAKASVLVVRMEPLVGRRYDEDSVSAWIRGRTVPPADALLAAAKVTGVSIDEYLQADEGAADGLNERLGQQAYEIENLSQQVERLTQVVATVPELQETIRTQGEAIKRMAKQLASEERQHSAS